MNRTFIGAVISVFVFGIGGLARARSQQPTVPSANSKKASTVGLMRSLNTAERVYRANFGHFTALDTLLYDVNYIHHSRLRVQGETDDGTDIVPGLKATVVVPPTEDAYGVAVYDVDRVDQGFATFSDQSGLIYAGQPLQSADPLHATDINLVRTINTAEINYRKKYGHFADFDALNAEGLIKRYGSADVTFAKSPDVLPNLQVTVLVPAAQDTWLIALHDKSAEIGPYSVFSDASGIIYHAEPLH
ncbi:MAG TPA: hypothetical protein VJN69_11555 [Candidatus Acidoferrales bacterium]|nr:hypothetical protein [Candidatus Acidoferrales bacterium]